MRSSGFAGDFLRQLLIHAGRDVNFFGNFDLLRALSRPVTGAAVGLELHALNGQRVPPPANIQTSPPLLRNRKLASRRAFRECDTATRSARFSRYCATHSLAASMNSSISRCAMLRSERVMLFINPISSNSMTGSGRSKSIEPRRSRLRFKDEREIAHQFEIPDQMAHIAAAERFIAFEHRIYSV